MRREAFAASHSATTRPSVVVPRYAAGIVDAMEATSCNEQPVNRTVFAIASFRRRLDPAR